MFTVTQALTINAITKIIRFSIVPPCCFFEVIVCWLLRPLFSGRIRFDALQPPQELGKGDDLRMADDVHGGRQKATDDEKFLIATRFDSAQGEPIVFQVSLETELAVAKAVKKTGETTVERAGILAGAQHGNLIECFHADALLGTSIDGMEFGAKLCWLVIRGR